MKDALITSALVVANSLFYHFLVPFILGPGHPTLCFLSMKMSLVILMTIPMVLVGKGLLALPIDKTE